MKKTFILAAAAALAFSGMKASAQEPDADLGIMLYGASFAIPQNGWFEIACENMGARAINKAVSAEAIYNDARRMKNGTNYTTEELDNADVLVIMHVHNQNVADAQYLRETVDDYADIIATTTNYAVGYDYVIKKYIADCRALEFNEDSKYFGVEGGKPAKIMLCTHWNDSRTTYNTAIRTLAEKWNFPLIEFDVNIGFSKNDNADDPGLPSREMAHDTETIGDVKYGWHPKRGNNSPIQRRMAAIFTQTFADTYGHDFPFEVGLAPFCPVYVAGEDAKLAVEFKNGMFPYSISGGASAQNLEGKLHVATIENIRQNTTLSIESSDTPREGGVATRSTAVASADVLVADYCAVPDYDSYVTRLNTSQNNDNAQVIQLKVSNDASRKAYISFQASDLMPRNAERIVLRLFYKEYTLGYFNTESGRPMEGIETIGVEGNTSVYKGLNINWSTANNHNFEPIDAKARISTDMAGNWVGIDVTDWVNATLDKLEQTHGNQNTGHLTFRLFIEDNNWNALMQFYSTEGAPTQALANEPQPAGPQLLFTIDSTVSSVTSAAVSSVSMAGNTILNPACETVAVYSVDGVCRYVGRDSAVSLESYEPGVYVVRAGSATFKTIR